MNPMHTQYMIKSLNGNSVATFNSSKLTKLILNKTEIISEEDSESNYLLSGSYLCFPWVGRIISDDKIKELTKESLSGYPFKEQNNFPIHGLFAAADRKVLRSADEGNSITFFAESSEHWPFFKEEYTIEENSLVLKTSFENLNNKDNQYFAYGYHPYIGINRKPINNLNLDSNIQFHCLLNSQLVPDVDKNGKLIMTKMPSKPEENLLSRKIVESVLDDLFYNPSSSENENPFVHLIDKEDKIRVTVESDSSKSIQLNYFQLYTPERRNCIAIEPLSSPNNAFNIDFPNYLVELKPKEIKHGQLKISVEHLQI